MITQVARLLIASAFLGASAVAIAAPAVGDVSPPRVGFDLSGEPVLLTSFFPYFTTFSSAGKDSMQVIAVNTESREVFRKAARTLKELASIARLPRPNLLRTGAEHPNDRDTARR